MSTSLVGVLAGQWMAAAVALAGTPAPTQLHSNILPQSDGFAIIDASSATVQEVPAPPQILIGAAVRLDALLVAMDATSPMGVRP